MKIEINEDGTITIDGEIYKKVEKVVNVLSEPLHPTIDEIYDSVKPVYWVDSDGAIEENYSYAKHICKDSIATQKDAEYILATMQLINIANYYNAKYPSEAKGTIIEYCWNGTGKNVYHPYGMGGHRNNLIKFTDSAAKEALSNPNVVEVLNKYFRIK